VELLFLITCPPGLYPNRIRARIFLAYRKVIIAIFIIRVTGIIRAEKERMMIANAFAKNKLFEKEKDRILFDEDLFSSIISRLYAYEER